MTIPYGRQQIDDDDIQAVIDVLKSDYLTQGPQVPAFEAVVASYTGATHAVACNSATSALHIACLALGLGSGDWLWTTPTTFVASSNCALYCGAKVDFVDIDPVSYNMSMERLAEKLADAKQKGVLPKIVVPVHLCGQSCDMVALKALSAQYGFKIIEDASHAIGGRYLDQAVGGCQYSDITIFSFHPVKIITTGEGGMALTNDPALAGKMKRLRSHGISSDPADMQPRDDAEIWNYQQISLGFNYRMTDIHAALGISQMRKIDEFVEKRHRLAKVYDSELQGLPVVTPRQHPDTYSAYHLYPIRIMSSNSVRRQREVYDAMHKAGVLVNLHYIPVYRHPYYEAMGFQPGHCQEAERFHREVLSIPLYPTLADAEQSKVIELLQKALA